MKKSSYVLSAGFSLTLLGGCAGEPAFERGIQVQWADDVGTVAISKHGDPIEWDEVATDLQPNFKLDSATALANAMPITQSFDERLFDALTANVQAGLPGVTSLRTTNEVTDAETGEIVTTVDNTRTRQTGTVPAPAGLTPTGAAALTALASPTFGDDPMLRYLAATALLQEVALLNRYIKDQVRWPGSQAFVVRLQLNVAPNARSMPYDVEADITIHSEDEQSRAGLALPTQSLARSLENGATPGMPTAAAAIAGRQSECAAGSYDTLQVLPMIVTDNLEGMKAARSADNVRQLALSMLGTAGNVGLGGQFGRTSEALRRSEGRETNSLMTVAKLSDDTVRVRLGAVQSPRYGYVMSERNHFVSLVVVVRPCINSKGTAFTGDGERNLTVVSRTNFRDGATGRSLPYRPGTARLMEQISHIQEQFVGQFNYLELAQMYQWVTSQNRSKFYDYVVGKHLSASMCKPGRFKKLFGVQRAYALDQDDYIKLLEGKGYRRGDDGKVLDASGSGVDLRFAASDPMCLSLARLRYQMVAAPLWTELQSVRPTGQFAFTNVPVRLRQRKPALPPKQQVLVNLTSGDSTVTIPLGQDMLEFRAAQLMLVEGSGPPIPASTATIAANGRSVTGSFQPLARFGIKPTADSEATGQAGGTASTTAGIQRLYQLKLSMTYPNGQCPDDKAIKDGDVCVQEYPVRFFDATKASTTTPFTLGATATGIVADPAKGLGKLIVVVGTSNAAASADKLKLSVEGAQVNTATARGGSALKLDGNGWKVAGAGEIVLDLENLIPNTVVKVTLKDGPATAGTVSTSVISAASSKGS
ncbi:hypothetical protein [Sphingomonas qomolangmaensis]|uniref:Lipoprotein n=1 Tax=Sphingomonas qomolangmaensis TaxID=2918765 RepID=A0ABY5LAH2_9SPHN|nr:hypothetical protein [Sphingomonas qomolangmaensis]UUL83968.1 hypothetical protein NMP03_07195 [Sphingomonas qomolangmaensis]